jgi:phage baseplate assembly protein W
MTIYKDLDLNFLKNPLTNDVNVLTDELAIKRRLKNVVMTQVFENHFHPEESCQIRSMLFDPMTYIAANQMSKLLSDAIKYQMTDFELVQVKCVPDFDKNLYSIDIIGNPVNSNQDFKMNLVLKRTR